MEQDRLREVGRSNCKTLWIGLTVAFSAIIYRDKTLDMKETNQVACHLDGVYDTTAIAWGVRSN